MRFIDPQITKLKEFCSNSITATALLEDVLKYPEGEEFAKLYSRISMMEISISVEERLAVMVVKAALQLTPYETT